VDDVMLQCVICEDWFHGRHLGVEAVPDEDGFDEVICQKCLERCYFIRLYADHFPGIVTFNFACFYFDIEEYLLSRIAEKVTYEVL